MEEIEKTKIKNPIYYDNKKNEFYIWTSFHGIKIMKYFQESDKLKQYIDSNIDNCFEFKKFNRPPSYDKWIDFARDGKKELGQNDYSLKDDPPDFNFDQIFVGVVLSVIGLVSIIMRGEISLKIVGREQIFIDTFTGSSTISNTVTIITIIASIILIIGIVLVLIGMINFLNKMNDKINISNQDINKLAINDDYKTCPFCAETIKCEAIKCRFCGEYLNSYKSRGHNL